VGFETQLFCEEGNVNKYVIYNPETREWKLLYKQILHNTGWRKLLGQVTQCEKYLNTDVADLYSCRSLALGNVLILASSRRRVEPTPTMNSSGYLPW
jgi:hypothetical protein